MDIQDLPRCGNAPKMEHGIDITIAILSGNISDVSELVSQTFTTSIVGNKVTDSQHFNVSSQLQDSKSPLCISSLGISSLNIRNALSHGKGAMTEGVFHTHSGEQIAFCHVLNYENTRKDALASSSHWYLTAL